MPLPRTSHYSLLRSITLYQWVTLVLSFLFVGSLIVLLRLFYLANTTLVPTVGGTYIEGSIGELMPLNPWFIVTNDVNRDVVSLIFSGLLKYDPDTQQIEEDLASMRISSDGLRYTLRLKEDLFWHDTTEEDPHSVTADDVFLMILQCNSLSMSRMHFSQAI